MAIETKLESQETDLEASAWSLWDPKRQEGGNAS